jgi:GDP-mannose 4,6-dehydratase
LKTLITGITGFVGSHLADYILASHKAEVYGLKRWRSPMDNISHIKNKVHLYDGDLRDLSSMIYLLNEVKPDVIFHLAAQSEVTTSFIAPVDTLMTNVIGTANLLEAVRLTKQDPLTHICSSSEVYGQVLPDEVPIREDNPFRPASPYAVSKVAEDMLAWQYFTSWGIKTIRTRMFTHTGARQSEYLVTSNFAKQIAMIKQGLQPPVVWVGNLDSVRTFADVRDTVRAYWLMAEKYYSGKVKAGSVYNIGGTATMTVGEMLNRMLVLANLNGQVEIMVDKNKLRPSDVTLQIPCIDKFVNDTGWQPTVSFDDTMLSLLGYWGERVK